MEPSEDTIWREHQVALHEEIRRLPRGDRTAIVLCDLEGQAPDEAAHQLRWSLGRLDRRLARGRERLQARMSGRGFTIPVVDLAARFFPGMDGDVPRHLVEETIDAATRVRPRGVDGSNGRQDSTDEAGADVPLSKDGRPALAVPRPGEREREDEN